MKQYVDLLRSIMTFGERRYDRTGTGTISVFGGQLRFNLNDRFPLVTMKKTLYRHAFIEMLWFLRGEPNTGYLKEHGVGIWDDWADMFGDLGPIYGVQWRKWPKADGGHIDQIRELITGLKQNPTGRRHIVTAWNPTFIPAMGLPPCHRDFQCYVSQGRWLDMTVSIRSWDIGLGAPFNIAQYALLSHLISREVGLVPRHLIFNYGDAHVYINHIGPLNARLDHVQRFGLWDTKPTRLIIETDNIDIDHYHPDDFKIEQYESFSFIKLPIAV